MKALLALAVLFSLSHAEIEVTELFRAETPAELEAALVDGYPMPWLVEILTDSTIPEEDRYWLDCRMRAVIAQDLHLFFDEENNPVKIDADWIAPGEDYWRESFMVNGRGVEYLYDRSDQPTNVISEPGSLLNRYGEEIGNLAMLHRGVRLSRDASIGVTFSGRHDEEGSAVQENEPCFVCCLYPDGSFKEIPVGFVGNSNFAVSNDGSLIVVETEVLECSDLGEAHTCSILLLDNEGNTIACLPRASGMLRGTLTVSSTGRYVVYDRAFSEISNVALLDGRTGLRLDGFGVISVGWPRSFSPNERYLCLGGFKPMVFDCENLEEIWAVANSDLDDKLFLRFGSCSNDGRIIAFSTVYDRFSSTGTIVFDGDDIPRYSNETRGYIHVSPDGVFTFAQCYNTVDLSSWNDFMCVPVIVNRIEGGD